MSVNKLLFENHLMEEVSPGCFKILEPFYIDGKEWLIKNNTSGISIYCRDNLVYAVSYNFDKDNFIRNNLFTKGDKVYMATSRKNEFGGIQ